MKMSPRNMSVIDWTTADATEHAGEKGVAIWRTQQCGDIRLRVVEYTPGYVADHWCSKGHVIYCLKGSLDIALQDGQQLVLKTGQTYHVGDGDPAHRSSTPEGATLFIVD
jgi:quercetin dioxygenase-like cupin family protein